MKKTSFHKTVKELMDVHFPKFKDENNFPNTDENFSLDNQHQDSILDETFNVETNDINLNENLYTIKAFINKAKEKISFEEKIYNLTIKYRYTLPDAYIKEHLKTLREEGYKSFPKCVSTFLGTPRRGKHYSVYPMKSSSGTDGEYCYLGIEKQLQKYISPSTYQHRVIKVIVNIDGMQVYENKEDTMWPILLKIQTKKYEKKVFMVANYYGDSKPESADDFLSDFVTEASKLIKDGVLVNGVRFKFRILGFTCDIPARCFLKCSKGHTGFFSCERCITRGETLKKKMKAGKKTRGKRVFPEINCALRTHESFVNQEEPEHHLGKSALLDIPDFNIINDMYIDSMHALDLGVSKRIVTTWLSKKKKTIGRLNEDLVNKMDIMLNYYLRKTVPREFHRKYFNLQKPSKWKANQNRMFILYAAAFVTKEILSSEAYNHLLLYIVAYRILSDKNLCKTSSEVAKSFFIQFFNEMPEYYGDGSQVLTSHYTIHIADDVKNNNMNLIQMSAYDFENYLGKLSNLINGPSDPLVQVINRLSEIRKSSFIELKYRLYDIKFCEEEEKNNTDEFDIKSLKFKGYIIESRSPNNLVLLHDDMYFMIERIYSLKIFIETSDDIIVTGKLHSSESIFKVPCDSKEVGLVKIKPLNIKHSCYLSNIQRKCFFLSLENKKTFAATMLHED